MSEQTTDHKVNTLVTGIYLVPSSGGMPKTMSKFKEALDAKVVSFTCADKLAKEGSAFPGIEHIPCGKLASKLYAWAPPWRRKKAEALADGADLMTCHVVLRYHANWVRRMASKRQIPYWVIPHGQLDPYVYTYRAVVKRLWMKVFGKKMLREAAHVICATENEKQKAMWSGDKSNFRVIHWPVELVPVEGKEAARKLIREKLNIAPDAKVLVYLGRLHTMKRPVETIEAFCRAAKGRDAHLVLIGMEENVTIAQCRAAAEKHGLGDQVHVLGPVFGNEKNEYLLGSDAYVSLSIRENFGHTAAEALASGTPVILSPGNDLSPELKPYACGWFLESDRADEAVSAIQACLAADWETSCGMGAKGRKFIADECSYEKFSKSIVALRNEAVGREA
jgi:glycosyltransferase involved in cell wall biosynthesis